VEHRGDIVVEVAVRKPRQEIVLVEIIGDVAIDEITEGIDSRQAVDRDDSGFPARIQGADKARSDKPGGAGDDDVQGVFPA